MPSSTSLLENEETEPELPPLVQTFAGMGIDDHGAQSQAEQQTLTHPCRASPFSLLGAVLDLQPIALNQAGTEEEDDEKSEEEALNENESVSHSLLAQAHVPGLGSVMLPGHEAQETVVLYSDGLDDTTAQHVPMMIPYGESGYEPPLLSMRRKSVNTKECVEVPSSEHVAEIVGRQGCKIKALRAKTNTYIKTPVRGEEPVFVVTGRKEDVAMAKREIMSAAEHFSHIRASRNKAGPMASTGPGLTAGAPTLPGQTTIQVRVPYRVVGLVVGPKGATIKRIQQQTHTYIVTPSRDKEPVFEVTGMPENVDRAREEIEAHIALRTGSCVDMTADLDNDFHCNGTDVGFETAGHWLHHATPGGVQHRGTGAGAGSTRITASYRNDSSSSLGSGSSDSYYNGGGGGSNRMADFSPTSPFTSNSSSGSGGGSSSGGGSGGSGGCGGGSSGGGTGGSFWFGESSLVPAGSEDLAGLDPSGFDSLPLAPAQPQVPPHQPPQTGPVQMVWNPFEQGIQLFDTRGATPSFRDGSQPGTPRLSPTFQEALEHPMAQFVQPAGGSSGGYHHHHHHHHGSDHHAHKFPASYGAAFSSSSDSTTSNSPPDHQFCGPTTTTTRGGGLYSLTRE